MLTGMHSQTCPHRTAPLLIAEPALMTRSGVHWQAMGFAWTGVLFALCAAFYTQLTQPRLIPLFRLLYYLSRCAPRPAF